MIPINYQLTFHVGLIADTHGKLPVEVLQALKGVEQIIHAGDIHSATILNRLSKITPMKSVRGNMDRSNGLKELPATEVVHVGEAQVFVIHDLEVLDINPIAAGFNVVIYGYSHQPEDKMRKDALFLNPGPPSSPHRGSLPSVAHPQIRVGGTPCGLDRIRINALKSSPGNSKLR